MMERVELETCVPHKGRMFLLDRFVEWNYADDSFVAEAVADRGCLFYDPEKAGVPVWVAFEYMAQGIAALSGIGRRERGEEPKIGFVMSVRDFEAGSAFFPEGSRVRIEARELMRDGNVVAFSCSAEWGGARTTATINVIETDKDP